MSAEDVRDALFIASDFRANFKNVIAKRSDLVKFDGGRLDPGQYGVTLQAGTVLGVVTASGKYAPYNDAASDGTQVAVGLLGEIASPDAAGNGSEIIIIRGGGVMFKDLLVGYDAAAKADLGAKEFVEHGVNLMSF